MFNVKCSWDALLGERNCFCVWSFWCSELCSVDQTVTVQRGSVLDVRSPDNVVPGVFSLYTLPKNTTWCWLILTCIYWVYAFIFCHNNLPVTLKWWHLLILSSPHAPVCRRVTMRFGKSGSSISPAGPITAFPATPQACWASSARSSSSILQTQDPSWYTAGVLLSKPLLHLFLRSLSHSSYIDVL